MTMTDGAATDCRIYYCVVCGPCLQELIEDAETDEVYTATYHEREHPPGYTQDEEDNPQ